MLNYLRPSIPLLDPSHFTKFKMALQNQMWEGHPYHFSIELQNQNELWQLTHSYHNERISFVAKNGKSLRQAKGNPNEHHKQFLLYQDVIFKQISNYYIRHIENSKERIKPNTLQAQLEEKDYQWLLATTKILKNSIQRNKDKEDFLLQYDIHVNFEDNSFLRIKCFNLYFEFYHYQENENCFKIIVLNTKNNENAPAEKFELTFLEQVPRAVDIMSDLLLFLREASQLNIK